MTPFSVFESAGADTPGGGLPDAREDGVGQWNIVAAAGGGHHFVTLSESSLAFGPHASRSSNSTTSSSGSSSVSVGYRATRVHVWGKALGDHTDFAAPRLVTELGLQTSVLQICAGTDHVLLLSACCSVWSFGCGFFGRLGHGNTRNDPVCRRISFFVEKREETSPVAVAAGGNCSAVVCRGPLGTDVYTFGYGKWGALGLGDSDAARADSHTLPERVSSLAQYKITQVVCGDRFMCALDEDGIVYSWGTGEHGELGRGKKQASSGVPQQVPFEDSAGRFRMSTLSAGGQHVAAIEKSGSLWTWGRSEYGRLGYTRRGPQMAPCYVRAVHDILDQAFQARDDDMPDFVESVSCGQAHTVCVSRRKRVIVFGWNKYGQCGINPNSHGPELEDKWSLPVESPLLRGASLVASGGYATLAVIREAHWQLIQAARSNDLDLLRYLISGDGDWFGGVNALDSVDGLTALHWAVCESNLSAVELLVRVVSVAFLTRFSANEARQTVFHLAAQLGDSVSFLEILSGSCCSASLAGALLLQNSAGETPLHCAVRSGTNATEWLAARQPLALFVPDSNGNLVSDIADPRVEFRIRVAARKPDVVIVHHPSSLRFAEHLRGMLGTTHNILAETASSAHLFQTRSGAAQELRRTLETLLCGVRVVVFLSEQSSVGDERCTEVVRLICEPEAKPSRVSEQSSFERVLARFRRSLRVLPVWVDRVDFPPLLESLLFRRQLVDFSGTFQDESVVDSDKFAQRTSQLALGIRKAAAPTDADDDDDNVDDAVGGETADAELKETEYYACLVGDAILRSAVPAPVRLNLTASTAELQGEPESVVQLIDEALNFFQLGKLRPTNLSNSTSAMTANSELVLRSSVVVVLLPSPDSDVPISRKTKNLMSLAENHGIPLLPVAILRLADTSVPVDAAVYGDPAVTYMLAKYPLFCASSPAWALNVAAASAMHLQLASLKESMRKASNAFENASQELSQLQQWYGDHKLSRMDVPERETGVTDNSFLRTQHSLAWASLET